jgi:hypothetical protein
MAKSTAKAESLLRDLKDRLELRGFAIAESKDSEGWPKLTLNTDEASIRMEAVDMVSKDVFGNDNVAFAPHFIDFASRDNMATATVSRAEIMIELAKTGIDKTIVKTHATVLATAEAAVGDAIVADVRWPTKGI